MDRGLKRGAEGEQEERRSVRPRLQEEMVKSNRRLEEEVRSHAKRQEEVVEELEDRLEQLEQELTVKEQDGEKKEQKIRADNLATKELKENHQTEMQQMKAMLSKQQQKVEAMETFEQSVVETLINPDVVDALETMKKQQQTIVNLERKLKALEDRNKWTNKSVEKKSNDMPAKDNVQNIKRRLLGINITIAKAEPPKDMQKNGQKIPRHTPEIKEVLKNNETNNLSNEPITNVATEVKDALEKTFENGKEKHLIEEFVEDEMGTLIVESPANEMKDEVNKKDTETGTCFLIRESVEDTAEKQTESQAKDEVEMDPNATNGEMEEEETFDPFWFCGPPSEVLLTMNNCSTAEEFLKMKEDQAKEERRKELDDEKKEKLLEVEDEIMKRKTALEEEMRTRQWLADEEENTRKRKRQEEDDCGFCYKRLVHECAEDVLVC